MLTYNFPPVVSEYSEPHGAAADGAPPPEVHVGASVPAPNLKLPA